MALPQGLTVHAQSQGGVHAQQTACPPLIPLPNPSFQVPKALSTDSPLGAGSKNTTGMNGLHRLYFSLIEHRKVWAGRGGTATSPGSQTQTVGPGGEGEES